MGGMNLVNSTFLAVVCAAAMLFIPRAEASTLTSAGVFGNGRAFFHPTRVAAYRFRNSVIRLRFDFARKILVRETAEGAAATVQAAPVMR
jgi:hypothetical protein